MKRLLFLTFTSVLVGSCVSMPPDQVNPALGEFTPMQEEVKRNIEQMERDAPGFLKRNQLPTSDELVEELNDHLSPRSNCNVQFEEEEKANNNRSPLLDNPESQTLLSTLGDQPAPGGNVTFKLTDPGEDVNKVVQSGYQLYGQEDKRIYGTARTIWNLQAAGRLLSKEGIIMGVGDISQKNGGSLRPTHNSHRAGNDVDLRFINKAGIGKACYYQDKSCYDEDKTYTMMKALVDVDPNNIKTMYVNDPSLNKRLRDYLKNKYQMTEAQVNRKVSTWAGHDNHIHISWNGG